MRNVLNPDFNQIRKITEKDLENSWSIFEEVYPLQEVLQEWLRKEFKIFILIQHSDHDLTEFTSCVYKTHEDKIEFLKKCICGEVEFFDDYNKALENGLVEGLSKIED